MTDPTVQRPDFTGGLASLLGGNGSFSQWARLASGLPANPQTPSTPSPTDSTPGSYQGDPGDVQGLWKWLADRWKQDEQSAYGQTDQADQQHQQPYEGPNALGHHMANWADPTLQQPRARNHHDWQHGFRPDQPYQQGSPANRPGAAMDAMQRGRGLYGWNPQDVQRGALSRMIAPRPRQQNWDAYGY